MQVGILLRLVRLRVRIVGPENVHPKQGAPPVTDALQTLGLTLHQVRV